MATIVSLLVGALVAASALGFMDEGRAHGEGRVTSRECGSGRVARFGARGAASNGHAPWWNVVLRSMA